MTKRGHVAAGMAMSAVSRIGGSGCIRVPSAISKVVCHEQIEDVRVTDDT